MTNITRIFMTTHSQISSEGYLRGYITVSADQTTTIYFTKSGISSPMLDSESDQDNIIYGYYGSNIPQKKFVKCVNQLVFNKDISIVKEFILNRQHMPTSNIILMYYDYNKLRESQTITDVDISKLQSFILKENDLSPLSTLQLKSLKVPNWLKSSMFLQHVCNCINLVKWLYHTIKQDKKISIKQGNLILAFVIDIILGYILLQLLTNDTKYISSQLMDVFENLIKMLYSLLTWLMGAPVGLKLNNAFNKMLGKYFSYHVQLWWLFLDTSKTKLDMLLHLYYYIGHLGLTFQIAVLSDMICLATFHSYCIYVYAARLFNIQISGLTALLRLFVGRKYNPLRGGIDSCEYTNQELFVGTVAFTILLLLLPTTAMYYIVFTMFRILSITVQHILSKTIYIVQTLPFYVGTLWLIKSSKVAGNVLIEIEPTKDSSPLVLKVELMSKSILELINNFKPPVEVPKPVEWSNLISNILRGKQLM